MASLMALSSKLAGNPHVVACLLAMSFIPNDFFTLSLTEKLEQTSANTLLHCAARFVSKSSRLPPAFFTLCEKKLGVETGNEAKLKL